MPQFALATGSKDGAGRFLHITSPTFLENWPAGLRKLSIRQSKLRLPHVQHFSMLLYLKSRRLNKRTGSVLTEMPAKNVSAGLSELKRRLDVALRFYRRGGYLRLGSRSP